MNPWEKRSSVKYIATSLTLESFYIVKFSLIALIFRCDFLHLLKKEFNGSNAKNYILSISLSSNLSLLSREPGF